jgi:quercetin dioxygenase-like cupin family protein
MWGFAVLRKLRNMPPVESLIVADVVVSAEQSGGAYALLDVRAGGDLALDPHVVRQEDLLLYVLAGDLVVVLDGRRYALAAGDFLALPRRVPRAMRMSVGTRALCLVRPAGGERLAWLAADPAVTVDDRLALLAAAGVQMLPRSLWRVDAVA